MRLCSSVIAALLLVSCGGAQTDTQAEAETAFMYYVDALNSGKPEVAAAMYDDVAGFHWVERGEIQYDSADEAVASLVGLSESGGTPNMTIHDVRVAELGDGAALVSANFDFDMLSNTGDLIFSFDGWMTVGMVKRPNGWRIAGGQTGPGSPE